MNPNDPIRATHVSLDGEPCFWLVGHPDAIAAFLMRLDGNRTDHAQAQVALPSALALRDDAAPKAHFVWAILSSTSREDLAAELRKASDGAGIDLVLESDLATADTDRPPEDA